ncbi:MAG: rhomboid family intramembrane serine protease [Candidatus Sulfotelmatobacter sp.]
MANCIRCGRQLPGFSFGKKICPWCRQHEAAQRGELADDAPQPVIRTPWARRQESTITLTHIIFGMNVAVFLGMALSAQTVMDFPVPELVRWGANIGALTISGEWWRLLTNIFVHAGIIHIAFNMWCLWYLGQLAEQLYGAWTYGCIYLICGIGASLTSAAWHPYVPSVGASGAIFGLAGALFTAIKLGEFSVPRAALSGTLRSLGAFVVYNLIFGFAISGVDNAAHIGGLITGVVVGALIALIAPRDDQAPRRSAVFLGIVLALAFCAMQLAHHYNVPLRLQRVPFARNKDAMPGRAIPLQDRTFNSPTARHA